MKNYICIHGHFYQPPRENAWLEAIEQQPSAGEPYHDWNDRINVECYRSNANARLLNSQKLIRNVLNNYENISFNFGPTLLSWIEKFDLDTYQKIILADKNSIEKYGHGNALAQVYNHIIQPLANARDNETQIIWGLRDFESRFGRKAEGIWLAETAADTPTLEFLATQGVKFTVLSPNQVKSVRPVSEKDWQPKDYHSIDTRRAYRCNLPSGKHIDLFFYDGNTAKDVAFNRLLNSGQVFADRLILPIDGENQLVHIATDGESYGHHHKFGEMALAYAIEYLQEKENVELINYATFLEKFPPTWEAQIHENSSWSCAHGVERWKSDCGCHTGGEAGWNQQWRAPLRAALDFLRDELTILFEKEGKYLFKDVWNARNEYIDVLVDSSNRDEFLTRNQFENLNDSEKAKALQLLEMQKLSMFMYTSCGWFFNEISGIETVQILQYADKAIHLAKQFSDTDFEKVFLAKLEQTPSNIFKNAKEIFEKEVIPRRMSQEDIVWNILIDSILENNNIGSLFGHHYALQEVTKVGISENQIWYGNIEVVNFSTLEKDNFRFHFFLKELEEIKGRIFPIEEFQEVEELEIQSADEGYYEQMIVEVADPSYEPKNYTEKDALPEVVQNFYEHLSQKEKSTVVEKLRTIQKLHLKTKNYDKALQETLSNYLTFTELERVLLPENELNALEVYVEEIEDIRFSKEQQNQLSLQIDEHLARHIDQLESSPDFVREILDFLKNVEKLDLPITWYLSQNKLFSLKSIRFLPHHRECVIQVYSKLKVLYPFPLIATFASANV